MMPGSFDSHVRTVWRSVAGALLAALVGCGTGEPGERVTQLGQAGAAQDAAGLTGLGKDAGYLVRDITAADTTGPDQATQDVPDQTEAPDALVLDDTQLPDAGEAADANQADPAEQADLADSDSGPASPPAVPIWLQGDWLGCPGTLTIGPTSYSFRAAPSCVITGSASWDGQLLSIAAGDAQDCYSIPKFLQPDVGAAAQGEILTLAHPELTAGVVKLVRPGGSRERWLVTLENNAQTEMRLCYDKTGKFHAGDYSGLNKNCMFFSCGGVVSNAVPSGSNYHLWTTCGGGCPCGGIAVLTEKSATAMSGKLQAANCEKGYSMQFTGQLQPWVEDPPAP